MVTQASACEGVRRSLAGRPGLPTSCLLLASLLLTACSHEPPPAAKKEAPRPAPIEYFHVDPASAGAISGHIVFHGARPKPRHIDMDSDSGCPKQGALEETIVTGKGGGLANAFVYIQTGFEGKHFELPTQPVSLNQHGCMFTPRVLGIRAGQMLNVRNSDEVSHNIHPMPTNNREWNQQQPPQTPDLEHKFPRPDVMIPVKCNVHSWMHAYIGVVDHPYFAVTGPSGDFDFSNVPPGDYTIAVWHEKLGELKQPLHLDASGKSAVNFTYP
jgi:plastocyanin